ncbi:zinc finger, C2H2 type [Cooperia oncophora]
MHQFHAHAQFVGLLIIGAKPDFKSMQSCGFPPTLDIAYTGDITYCLWDNCHDNFSDPLHLFNHVMTHIDFLSSDDRVCDEESMSLPQHRCLWENCYRQFEIQRRFELCLLCQRRFGDERSLVNHVRRHINGRQCPTCGLAVQLPSDLHRHILVKHTERIKTLTCPECDKSFYCAVSFL